MKIIQMIAKWLLYTIFIIIAGLGIGLSGGVPLPKIGNRDKEKIKTELIEKDRNTDDCYRELT